VEIKDDDFRGCAYASETVSRGASLILYDAENDDRYELDRKNLIWGLTRYIEKHDSELVIENKTINYDFIDMEVADCIVQYALFDQIVFESNRDNLHYISIAIVFFRKVGGERFLLIPSPHFKPSIKMQAKLWTLMMLLKELIMCPDLCPISQFSK